MLDKNNENVNNSVENEDGSIEFSFGEDARKESPKTALVFEEVSDGDDTAEQKPNVSEDPAFDIFDIAMASENISDEELRASINESNEDMSSGSDGEEFIIPDSVDLTSESDSYVSTIWRPYMPRFTDTTKDRYYFADNSEQDKLRASEANAFAESEEPSDNSKISPVTVVKVDKRDTSSARVDYNDPTAEIDAYVPDVVVVNINGKPAPKDSTINIFKFPDEKKEEKPQISEEELERREISGLTGHKWEEKVDEGTAFEEVPSEISEEAVSDEDNIPSSAAFADEAPYLSYPEDKSVKFERREEHIPAGYDKNNNAPANDTSEYNSFSMRDTFKDKFLDSIMASRIRLAVAIILGILCIAFDVFKRPICTYFKLFDPKAPAVIDACLIVSLILISMPETVSSIKHLIRGAVVPELSLTLGGVTLLGYSIAMASVPASKYPLFSCVYAIMVINGVFATDYLHSTHFSAFKIVSEKGNKQIIDKPYTRDLELENAALDGAVDEYKSKTAGLYTTPFVSGFFKNASKNSENSKNNLIILASTFGIAVVIGLVMFFVKGAAEALSAFALVVALALPAFSILSHKLPYKNVQEKARLEKSAVIGEHALYDYSDVDVITFEDTEVFGPDDVTLKSASDRRSDYIDTMRKMASLFAALGGPLCRVFESALNKKYAPADSVVIDDDGVEGIVDGKLVMAGNAEYMNKKGIKIPNTDDKKIGSTRVIYAASEGEFFATFTVHYSFSEEFALELSAMRENGIVPLVYTRDFNINNEFLKILTGGNDVIRVMKKYTPVSEPEVYSKINATMVTFGGKGAAINLILSSKRYSKFKALMSITELTACLTGAALAVAIALSNMMVALPAAILAIWQLGWSIALAIMCRRVFNPRKKEDEDAEQ